MKGSSVTTLRRNYKRHHYIPCRPFDNELSLLYCIIQHLDAMSECVNTAEINREQLAG